MKRIQKGEEPAKLAEYREKHPQRTWGKFRKTRSHSKKIMEKLVEDQYGLCAYCEMNLKKGDQQVEHYHPKNDFDPEKNWHLEWENLLGVCAGGKALKTPQNIAQGRTLSEEEEKRQSTEKHFYSCDVVKQGENREDIILDPLKIPFSPNLLRLNEANGQLEVDEQSCERIQIPIEKVKKTIQKLNLNATRLNRERLHHLNYFIGVGEDQSEEELGALVRGDLSIQEEKELMTTFLLPRNKQLYRFFSTSRYIFSRYADSDVEQFFQEEEFQG